MKLKFVLLLLVLSSTLFSQEISIPVSPNISSLGEYGNFPIGYHTGTPVIEFPFYEINLDGLIIPIKLKYNSSGIRVDQSAGWVGLGWALETGGHITKEVRGYNDFIYDDVSAPGGTSSGYYYVYSGNYGKFLHKLSYDPKTGIITGGENLMSDETYAVSNCDNEPDLYHFNFCNYSGTFYFKPHEAGEPASDFIKPIIKSSNQYLDITYNKVEGSWCIIDQQGFKFIFEPKERTWVYVEKTKYETPEFSKDKNRLNLGKRGAITDTSCLLQSIESPRGKKVSFTYNVEHSSTPIMTSHNFDIPILMEGLNGITIGGGGYNSYNYTYSKISQLLPKTIEFSEGSISFITSGRTDLDLFLDNYDVRSALTPLRPQKLDKIIIKDLAGNDVKNIRFNYNYMGDSTDYKLCRLMLNSFEITDKQGQGKHQYKFSYKSGVLPAKNSYSTDMWGYYNGAINKVQFPTYTTLKTKANTNNIYKYPESYLDEGANRFTHDAYIQYGTLDMIEYPTGGKTRFVYEPHDFQDGTNSGFIRKVLPYSSLSYSPDNSSQQSNAFTYGKDFVLEEDSYLRLTYHYHINNSLKPALPTSGRIILQGKTGSKYVDLYDKTIYIVKNDETINFDRDAIYLKKGTYRINLWRSDKGDNGQDINFNYHVTANAVAFIWHNESKGGGLRIKEIQNIDNGVIVNKKQYSYSENGMSSGCLLSTPDYAFLQILDPTIRSSLYYSLLWNEMVKFMPCYKGFSPNWGTPFIPNNGAAPQVVYKYVEEKNVDINNKTTGKTTYRYMAEPLKTKIPFPLPKDYHVGNGSLLEEAYYDSDGMLLKKKVFSYSFKSIPNAQTSYIPKFYEPGQNSLGLMFYEIKPEFWSLDSTLETDYFDHGRNFASKRTGYKYDMKNRLVNIQTVTFGNTSLVTRTKFAKDFTDQIAGKMVEKNMIGIPLETITLKDEKIISGSKTQYVFNAGLNAVLKKGSCTLKQVPSLTLANNYSQYFEEDYTVSKYDDSGNPVEVINKDGTHDIYLWSYNGQYVVAEIKNSTYAVVNSALSSVGLTSIASLSTNTNPDKLKLDKLRSQPTLSDARITTYKFMPLIGVTQMTDASGFTTYYEYDTFGRLIRTKDLDNNMIQKNDYHYRNE